MNPLVPVLLAVFLLSEQWLKRRPVPLQNIALPSLLGNAHAEGFKLLRQYREVAHHRSGRNPQPLGQFLRADGIFLVHQAVQKLYLLLCQVLYHAFTFFLCAVASFCPYYPPFSDNFPFIRCQLKMTGLRLSGGVGMKGFLAVPRSPAILVLQ